MAQTDITTQSQPTPSTSTRTSSQTVNGTETEAERCTRIAQATLAKCEGCNGVCYKELAEDRYWQPAFENGEWTIHHCEYYVEPEPANLPKAEDEPEAPMVLLGDMFDGLSIADALKELKAKVATLKPQYEAKYGKLTDEKYRLIRDAEFHQRECEYCNGKFCNKPVNPFERPHITADGKVEMRLCEVWRKVAAIEQCERSGLPRKYIKRTFDDYEVTKDNAEAVKAAQWFLRKPRDKGLYLYGGAGTGKTFLASLIACEHIRNGKRAIFGDVPELLSELKKTFDKGGTEQVLNRYMKTPLLVLDDFGAGQITEWTVGILYQIINNRYNNDRVTIVTCNYDLEGLGERLSRQDSFGGQRIISRLKEMTYQAFLGTVDRRKSE